MSKFLDMEGLTNLVGHIKDIADGKADTSHSHDNYATKDELASAGKVASVNGQIGEVTIDTNDPDVPVSDVNDLFTDESSIEEVLSAGNFYTKSEVDILIENAGGESGVTSVNGETGDVTIDLDFLPLNGGTVTGDTTFEETFTAKSSAYFENDVDITDDLKVGMDLDVDGSISSTSGIETNGDITTDGLSANWITVLNSIEAESVDVAYITINGYEITIVD